MKNFSEFLSEATAPKIGMLDVDASGRIKASMVNDPTGSKRLDFEDHTVFAVYGTRLTQKMIDSGEVPDSAPVFQLRNDDEAWVGPLYVKNTSGTEKRDDGFTYTASTTIDHVKQFMKYTVVLSTTFGKLKNENKKFRAKKGILGKLGIRR